MADDEESMFPQEQLFRSVFHFDTGVKGDIISVIKWVLFDL